MDGIVTFLLFMLFIQGIGRTTSSAGLPSMILATTRNYPDALVAGVAGERGGSPVLLTPKDELPEYVNDLLDEGAPRRVYLVGGPSVIGNTIEQDLVSRGIDVIRLFGITKFGTAAVVATTFWPDSSEEAVLAHDVLSGHEKGDEHVSLAAAKALASVKGAPLLFTEGDALSMETGEALVALDVERVHLVGTDLSEELIAEIKRLDIQVVVYSGMTVGDVKRRVRDSITKDLASLNRTVTRLLVVATREGAFESSIAIPASLDRTASIIVSDDGEIADVIAFVQENGIESVKVVGIPRLVSAVSAHLLLIEGLRVEAVSTPDVGRRIVEEIRRKGEGWKRLHEERQIELYEKLREGEDKLQKKLLVEVDVGEHAFFRIHQQIAEMEVDANASGQVELLIAIKGAFQDANMTFYIAKEMVSSSDLADHLRALDLLRKARGTALNTIWKGINEFYAKDVRRRKDMIDAVLEEERESRAIFLERFAIELERFEEFAILAEERGLLVPECKVLLRQARELQTNGTDAAGVSGYANVKKVADMVRQRIARCTVLMHRNLSARSEQLRELRELRSEQKTRAGFNDRLELCRKRCEGQVRDCRQEARTCDSTCEHLARTCAAGARQIEARCKGLGDEHIEAINENCIGTCRSSVDPLEREGCLRNCKGIEGSVRSLMGQCDDDGQMYNVTCAADLRRCGDECAAADEKVCEGQMDRCMPECVGDGYSGDPALAPELCGLPGFTCASGCSDSDGGRNYQLTGVTTGVLERSEGGKVMVNASDRCASPTRLIEHYCRMDGSSSIVDTEPFDCMREGRACRDGACVLPIPESCTDSDGGSDLGTKGHVTGVLVRDDGVRTPVRTSDTCINTTHVLEYSCTGKDGGPEVGAKEHDCTLEGRVCREGACVVRTLEPCIDSDGGRDHRVRGIVTGVAARSSGEPVPVNASDTCLDGTRLAEHYCSVRDSVPYAMVEEHDCAGDEMVCRDGACEVRGLVPCIDSDGGRDHRTRGHVTGVASGPDGSTIPVDASDECLSGSLLAERYCAVRDSVPYAMVEEHDCTAEGRECRDGACEVRGLVPCIDSDGGRDHRTRGHVTGVASGPDGSTVPVNASDACLDGVLLLEHYCALSGEVPYAMTEEHDCTTEGRECRDGACEVRALTPCSDSDGGQDYTRRGIVIGVAQGTGSVVIPVNASDECLGEVLLAERYCSVQDGISYAMVAEHDCDVDGRVCRAGACVLLDSSSCHDSDGGRDDATKGQVMASHIQQGVASVFEGTDACFNETLLSEWTCSIEDGVHNGTMEVYDCALDGRVCRDGACVERPVHPISSLVGRNAGIDGTVNETLTCVPGNTVVIEPVTSGKFILMIGEEEITRSVLRVHPSPNSTINFQQHYALIRFDLSKRNAERMSNITCSLGFQPNPNPPGGGCTQFLDELLHIFLEGELYRSIYICEELHCKAASTLTIHVTSDDDDVLQEDFNRITSILENEGREKKIIIRDVTGAIVADTFTSGTIQDIAIAPVTCGAEGRQNVCISSVPGGCS